MLGLEPDKTIYDLVVAPGELDSEKLAGYTTRHQCGLDILPAPLRPEDAELVTESKLARLLEVARESYDVIVVDTSPFFHGPMLATLDRTDELLMICGLDVPTLKNVRLSMQTLELLSFPAQRIRFVLNRSNSKVGMKKKEVEDALGIEIRFELPSDRAVPLGVNRGQPPAIADAGADFSRAIGEVAERPAALAGPAHVPTAEATDPYAELKTNIHHAVIAKVGPELFKRESGEDLSERVLHAVTEQLALDRTPLTREERRRIVREIADDVLGYGPLEPLLRDDSVTEVMVNNHDRIFVERSGRLERAEAAFVDNAHLLRIIDKIVSQVGRRIDEASPMVDARLPDGSRVNAIIPPLSLKGPA